MSSWLFSDQGYVHKILILIWSSTMLIYAIAKWNRIMWKVYLCENQLQQIWVFDNLGGGRKVAKRRRRESWRKKKRRRRWQTHVTWEFLPSTCLNFRESIHDRSVKLYSTPVKALIPDGSSNWEKKKLFLAKRYGSRLYSPLLSSPQK